jgi:predicted ABC-type ATPase
MGMPKVVVIGGPNGAGKSTTAPTLLREALEVHEFVNADAVALGLSAFDPQSVAYAAGRVMLERLRQLAADRRDFAFETTLASRSFHPWIQRLQALQGYEFHLIYLWLPSAELAVERVAERVREGGHDVPSDTVRRRYERSLRNFFNLYGPIADSWLMLDNSSPTWSRPIAWRERGRPFQIVETGPWYELQKRYEGNFDND